MQLTDDELHCIRYISLLVPALTAAYVVALMPQYDCSWKRGVLFHCIH